MANTNIFQDTWTAIRHLFGGYTDQEKQSVQKDGQTVQQTIQANKDANGGTYSYTASLENTLGITGIKDSIDWAIIGIFGLIIATILFRK